MAKSDAKKRAEMMAKEWKKSRSNTRSLNDLIEKGLLHNQELGGWRTEWYKKWFYIREEPGSTTFCDVGYIPEKRVSWTNRPEFTGQVADLMSLIDWSRLDGP